MAWLWWDIASKWSGNCGAERLNRLVIVDKRTFYRGWEDKGNREIVRLVIVG